AHPEAWNAKLSVAKSLNSQYFRDVIQGYSKTVSMTGIRQLTFDVESELLSNMNWSTLLRDALDFDSSSAFRIEIPSEPGGLRYFERSVLYFCHLLSTADAVVSVCPSRQLALLSAAGRAAETAMGRRLGAISLLPYGDVLLDGALDSIKGSVFNAVDDYAVLGDGSIDALRKKYLSVRLGTTLHLDSDFARDRAVRWSRVAKRPPNPLRDLLLVDELAWLLESYITSGNYPALLKWAQRVDHRLIQVPDRSLGKYRMLLSSLHTSLD
ncbi:MAG: hypothetical protein JWN95_437, partial [Frankiales bacterium]|nr:hypothetical protein [Frankiales bacterium]